MPKLNIPERASTLFANAKGNQARIAASLMGQPVLARLCPYCQHKAALLYPGHHGHSRMKCPNCGEEVYFPPVTLRRPKGGA